MANQEDEESRLLDLPAEIRNNIYELALIEECVTVPCARPGLLQTCTKIRNEATQIYYILNKFATTLTTDIPHLNHWLAESPKHNGKLMLQSLTVHCEVHPSVCSFLVTAVSRVRSGTARADMTAQGHELGEIMKRALDMHIRHLVRLQDIGMRLDCLEFFSPWLSFEELATEIRRSVSNGTLFLDEEEAGRQARQGFTAIWKGRMEKAVKTLLAKERNDEGDHACGG